MLKKLRKNNKKGFTLVELIVVLVILAILAALLVPTLTGYIDKAKEKQIIAETRQIVMAAQTILDEKYATQPVGGTVTLTETDDLDEIKELSELSTITNLITSSNDLEENKVYIVVTGTKVSEVQYQAHGLKCKYDGTEYEVVEEDESFATAP